MLKKQEYGLLLVQQDHFNGRGKNCFIQLSICQKHHGKFILRIEDTDQTRYVDGAENYIIESLKWSGLTIDEGPKIGGEFGPYRQSERKHLYKQYANLLIEKGHAYYAFDSAEDLEKMREMAKKAKMPNWQYNSITRNSMKNSLTLPEDEIKGKIKMETLHHSN